MASETVDLIDWSHPPPSWAVPHELQVLHGVNAAYKLQDLLQQPGLEQSSTSMPVRRTACVATQGFGKRLKMIFSVLFAQNVENKKEQKGYAHMFETYAHNLPTLKSSVFIIVCVYK